MTPTDHTATAATRQQRPPVRQSTLVRSNVAHTFDVFVRTIGAWWPVQPYSAGQERVRHVTFEQRLGGRVYESWYDGTTVDWGDVLVWEPPAGFTISWRSTPAVTEVELIFSELGPSLTRVAVEHRGWDALTDEQLAHDCALPGGYLSGAYATGWSEILTRLTATVEADTVDHEPPR